ncbi:MAG: radical SAM protein [Bacteroidales bacterium]|nr:radical SAM protein [Bacteroidales bacterium]
MFYFQYHFLENCNLRCTHCYQHDWAKEMPDNNYLQSVVGEMEKALVKWNFEGRISLTGGEPFLYPEKLFYLIDSLENSEPFKWIGILTNGTLITEESAVKLSQYKKIKEIQISLDGADETTHDNIRGLGSFRKAIEAIELLKRNNIFTSIMFTLHNQNKHDAVEILKLANSLNVDAITVERVTPEQNDTSDLMIAPSELKNIFKEILDYKKSISGKNKLKIRLSRPLWALISEEDGGFCPAGYSCLTILHNGTVLPCRRLEVPIGNILEDGLFKIWYTNPVLWKLRNKSHLQGKCNDCNLIEKCGGCRSVAYAMTGDIMSEDPQCWKMNNK